MYKNILNINNINISNTAISRSNNEKWTKAFWGRFFASFLMLSADELWPQNQDFLAFHSNGSMDKWDINFHFPVIRHKLNLIDFFPFFFPFQAPSPFFFVRLSLVYNDAWMKLERNKQLWSSVCVISNKYVFFTPRWWSMSGRLALQEAGGRQQQKWKVL